MAAPKPFYDISKSSLVNLKAELHRKQERFRQKKQGVSAGVPTGYSAVVPKTAKLPKSAASNHVSTTKVVDREIATEDEKRWDRAKVILAEKAILYDKLSGQQYIPDEDDERILVDFSRKPHNPAAVQEAGALRNDFTESDDESDEDNACGPIPAPTSVEEEWTEYEDYLGRTRKCLRKDLADMMKDNERLRREMQDHRLSRLAGGSFPTESNRDNVEEGFDFGETSLSNRTLMSGDMLREIQRRDWETDAESRNEDSSQKTSKQQSPITYNPHPTGPVHYETIKDNEIRDLGVGYFKFSTDEAVRQEQLAQLDKLREQTITQRAQKEQLKAKRKALLDARLAKVRERKKLKSDEKEQSNEDEDMAAFEESLKPDPVPEHLTKVAMRDEASIRREHVRPWDIGKRDPKSNPVSSDKDYVAHRRNDRNLDFAPPSMYFAPVSRNPKNVSRRNIQREFPKDSSQQSDNFAASSSTCDDGQHKAETFSFLPSKISEEIESRFVSVHMPAVDYNSVEGDGSLPSVSDYKPWEHIKPPSLSHPGTESTVPQSKNYWSTVPPPNFYAEGSGRPMTFGHVTESEIREQAMLLFSGKVSGLGASRSSK